MNAIVLALIGMVILGLGYRYYSKFVAEKIFRLDPNYITPAHRYKDDVDFVPTNKFVLWGHHFTSVAGAAPIVGPAIAVYWGWLPAFLWVILGTVFAAGVHDFGTLVLSVRNKGQSVGTLAHRLIGSACKNIIPIYYFNISVDGQRCFCMGYFKFIHSIPSKRIPGIYTDSTSSLDWSHRL